MATATRQRAIDRVRESRETHAQWAAYLRAYPDYPTEDVGDIAHHERCIEGYDVVLAELGAT